MYIRNHFLKQPRRGKTREALITPYKRSAVWDLAPETSSDCGDSDTGARSAIRACLALLVLVLLASPLSAQHRDTLYVVEEEPVYDTLFVHDTLVPMQTDSTGFYTFSAGLNVNVLGGGPSIKYGISKNCAFQTDFSLTTILRRIVLHPKSKKDTSPTVRTINFKGSSAIIEVTQLRKLYKNTLFPHLSFTSNT